MRMDSVSAGILKEELTRERIMGNHQRSKTLSASPQPDSQNYQKQKSHIRPYRSPRISRNGGFTPNLWNKRQQTGFKEEQNNFGLKILLPSEEKKFNKQNRQKQKQKKKRSSTPNVLRSVGKLFKKKQKHAKLGTP